MSIFPGSIVPAGTQSQQALVMARQTEFVICNQSIYYYFWVWQREGTWEQIYNLLYIESARCGPETDHQRGHH
jgi:hypothetical protein